MSNQNVEIKPATINQTEPVKYGSFSGKFGRFQEGFYKDCIQYFSATEEQAHRVCLAFAADWNACAASFQNEETAFKLGSLSEDGEINLSESTVSKAKKVLASPAISIAKIRQEINKILKLGVMYKECTIPLMPSLELWLRGMSVKEVSETLVKLSQDK